MRTYEEAEQPHGHVFHTLMDHRGDPAGADRCVQCNGGVKRCKNCGQFDSVRMTRDCPRRRLLETEEARIVEGELDFIGARWVPAQREYDRRYP